MELETPTPQNFVALTHELIAKSQSLINDLMEKLEDTYVINMNNKALFNKIECHYKRVSTHCFKYTFNFMPLFGQWCESRYQRGEPLSEIELTDHLQALTEWIEIVKEAEHFVISLDKALNFGSDIHFHSLVNG